MKPKHNFLIGLLSIVTVAAYCQSAKTSFVASVSEVERITLVKTSIPLSEWHEISFWSQYKNYLDTIQRVSLKAYITLQELARNPKSTNASEALENGRKMIAYRFDELSVRRQFFGEIGHDHNGIIGLQFLQTEVMLDMMESSRIYENSPLRNFRFYPNQLSTLQFTQAKYNIISKALSLSTEEAAVFFPVYARYEEESEEILGVEYNLYELFSGEATDFTPALAKRQGYDLLILMDREIKLKEKYFNEMNVVADSSLAARFLVWEDYYSNTCKLNALAIAAR